MNYNIEAIPCTYNGQLFKSKLEAKWAYMFDSFGWKWAYEPSGIGGRIPDFILKGRKEIITEIKPEIFVTEEWLDEIYNAYKYANRMVLILTDKPFRVKDDYLLLTEYSMRPGDIFKKIKNPYYLIDDYDEFYKITKSRNEEGKYDDFDMYFLQNVEYIDGDFIEFGLMIYNNKPIINEMWMKPKPYDFADQYGNWTGELLQNDDHCERKMFICGDGHNTSSYSDKKNYGTYIMEDWYIAECISEPWYWNKKIKNI